MTFCFLLFGPHCSESAESDFFAGRLAVTRGNYERGLARLQLYLDHSPAGSQAARARFFRAKAFLGLAQYDRSRTEFQRVVDEYPRSPEAHKARYKISMIDFVQGNRNRARTGFQNLTQNPAGPLVPEATMMLEYIQQGTARTKSSWGR